MIFGTPAWIPAWKAERSSSMVTADVAAHAEQHVALALAALAVALSIGLPLGIAAATYAPVRSPTLALAGIGRTIPSLAVLMLLLPLLGVGPLSAIAALSLLAIPPIAIAVDLGIRGVPRAAVEAATGMGMTPKQSFARVVVPLALPVSFAGVRTAATETIASATLATFIGAGGLGDDIVRGLQTGDAAALWAGAAAVAVLALAADVGLGRVERLMEAAVT